MDDLFDAHVHITRSQTPWRGGADMVEDMVAAARGVGITRMVVMSLGDTGYIAYPTPDELRAANDHVLEAMARYPGMIYGFCYISPEHGDASLEEIARCIERGPMAGIKLWISRRASDPSLDPILRAAARLRVPVLQHAWYKTTGNLPDESTPADVAALARRHPAVTIQMAHLNGGGERAVHDVADCPNVVIDTSGGEPESALIEYAVDLLGPERIVFGSDAPVRDFAVQRGKVEGARLTEKQRRLILRENTLRLLGREA